MSRSTVQTSFIALALVTGLVMLASAALQPESPLSAPTPPDTEAVHRFYAVVNAVIATGNTSLLHAVVAPYFVERAPLPGEGTGRSGLEAYLALLHTVDPDLRIVAEDVAAAGDLTVARVSVEHGQASTMLTDPAIDLPLPWSPVDVVRVSHGLIVERWCHTDGTGLLQPLAQVSVELAAPAPRVVTLDRLTLATGAQWAAHDSGPHLLLLEAGTVHVEVNEGETSPPEERPAAPLADLSAGQSQLMPAGTAFSLTNVGTGTARIVVVAFTVPQVPGGDLVRNVVPPGTTVQTLAGGMATDVGLGPVVLTVGQVSLAPRTHLSLSQADGPTLLAVETGQLSTLTSEPAWMRRGSDGVSRHVDAAELREGDGATLGATGVTVIHNRGDVPVVALVLTVHANPAALMRAEGVEPSRTSAMP